MTTTALMREMISGIALERARQIGKRAYGTKHDFAGKAFCGVNDVISGIERMLPAGGVRNVDAAKPVEAVHQVARLIGRNCDGPASPSATSAFEPQWSSSASALRVASWVRTLPKMVVSASKFQFRMGNRVGDGHGVVDSRIGVDDDLVRQLRFSP
jgi:hypothetical protein